MLNWRDEAHRQCVGTLGSVATPLVTVWPVFTEAMHLLRMAPGGREQLWEMVERGAFGLARLTEADAPRMRELMRKYADLPMGLADAALVRVAERERIATVFTLDHDFRIYTPRHVAAFEILP
ncbi:MAG: PIN domain-containing protein [Chloroflexi bacterium]|nr:PIN domain-containing protein [Chloroflexota bacterium]